MIDDIDNNNLQNRLQEAVQHHYNNKPLLQDQLSSQLSPPLFDSQVDHRCMQLVLLLHH